MVAEKYPLYLKLPLLTVGLLALAALLYFGASILIPFIIAWLIATMLNPLVSKLQKKINRIAAILLVVVPTVLIAGSIMFLVISQVNHLGESMPTLVEKFRGLIQQGISWLSEHLNINQDNINNWFTKTQNDVLKNSGVAIGHTITAMSKLLLDAVLVPVYIFFILYYQPQMLEFIRKLASTKQRKLNQILMDTKTLIQSYLVGLLIEAFIVATLYSIGLLVLGIDYAILLGLIGALLNIIPYLGAIVSATLFAIVALLTKDSPTDALLVLILYFVVHTTDNFYLIPRIVASKLRLNALVSITVIFTGGILWGIPGMFLAIPLTGVLKVIFDHVESLKPWGYLLGDESLTRHKSKNHKQKLSLDK